MLVFGRNPNYPNVLTSGIPALETQVSNMTVENNLQAINSVREHSFSRNVLKRLNML